MTGILALRLNWLVSDAKFVKFPSAPLVRTLTIPA